MEKIRGCLGIIFLLLPLLAIGQSNLVLNPSFELPDTCASFGVRCSGSTVTNWYSPTNATPDWFSACGGIPSNYAGYQYPRTGNAYAGIGPGFGLVNYREYVTGQFSVPLTANKKYCVTFYNSFADSVPWAISALGAYISDSAVCIDTTNEVLPYIPQIENPLSNLLLDSLGWQPISGEYTATGGEEYITIGDFYNYSATNFTHIRTGSATWKGGDESYYYIDDVSVRELVVARAGQDTNICNGQPALIGEDSALPGVSYYWQPATGLANPNSAQTLATPTVTTTYTLTVVNDSARGCNCPDSISQSVVTVNVCRAPLFVPTAFSPNGDGQNDILLVKGNDIQNFYLAIYDRWGNKVFESNDINDGWDGTYKGMNENTGTYVYYLKGTYTDGNNFEKKGSVVLVR